MRDLVWRIHSSFFFCFDVFDADYSIPIVIKFLFIYLFICLSIYQNRSGLLILLGLVFLLWSNSYSFLFIFIYLRIVYLVLFIYLCVLDNLVFGISVKSMKITVNGYLDSKKLRVCKELRNFKGYLDSKKLRVCKELRKFQRSSQNCEMAFDEGRFAWCAILSRFSLILHVTCFYTFNNCKHNNILIRCTTMAKSIIYLKNNIFAMQPHWSVQVMVLWRH